MERDWNKPVSMARTNPEEEKEIMNFPPLGFRLIGLRVYTPDNCSRELRRYVHCMQKSLFGRQDWFYFCKGFKINGTPSQGFNAEVSAAAFDASFNIFRGTRDIVKHRRERGNGKSRLENLNINAVVGQNGSGKSSMVDMIVRIINNLSAAIYGEHFIYNSAQHLHYIENVDASLAVYIDDCIHILTVCGHDIYLDKFLMDSGIFFNSADNSTTSVVAYNDFEPTRFDYLFKHTLWNTIITKDTSLLSKYAYYFDHSIEKYTSVIVNEKFPNPTGNTVVILGNESDQIPQYFDSYLLKMIVDGKPEVIKKQDTDNSLSIVNLGAVINGSQDTASFDHIDINPYEIKEKEKEPTNDTGIDPELLYVFDVIYNYVKGIDETIDYQRLIKYFDNPTLWNYRYHLIIIYILKSKYESIYNNGTNIGA